MNEKCQQLHFAASLKNKTNKINPCLFLTISFTNINTNKTTIKENFVQLWLLNFKRHRGKLDFIHRQET